MVEASRSRPSTATSSAVARDRWRCTRCTSRSATTRFRRTSATSRRCARGIAQALEEWLDDCLSRVSGQELTHQEVLARDAVVDRD